MAAHSDKGNINVGSCVYKPLAATAHMASSPAGVPTSIQVFDLGSSDPRAVAIACSDAEQNLRASCLVQRLGYGHCVYVISEGDAPVAKIGIANDPISRLAGLQTANWRPLSIHSLFWVQSGTYLSESKRSIETTALKAAAEMGLCLSGEWVEMEPIDASELVVKAARYVGIEVVDSATWITNLGERASAIAQAKIAAKRVRRIAA